MIFPLNLTLSFIISKHYLSRDAKSPKRCYVNKVRGGVNDLPYSHNFDLLLF